MPAIRKNARLYTVIENMPGYMPSDDSPFQSLNRKAAESVIASMASDLREDYNVSGNASQGDYWATPRSGEGSDLHLSIGECDLVEMRADRMAECMSCGVREVVSHIYLADYHEKNCIVNQ